MAGISKTGRLVRREEFERAFRANRLSNHWFAVYAYRREDGAPSRLGMTISKKTAPRAVTRNYTKRLIREIFRKDMSARRSLDVVVSPRIAITRPHSKEGRRALERLLQEL